MEIVLSLNPTVIMLLVLSFGDPWMSGLISRRDDVILPILNDRQSAHRPKELLLNGQCNPQKYEYDGRCTR